MKRAPATTTATARFFLRIGQVGRARAPKDEHTLPLFPLVLIMDCEGLLSRETQHLAKGPA